MTPDDQTDRFTDRSRKVLRLAERAADMWGHRYVGTEHLLMGLVKEGNGVAAAALRNLGVTPEMVAAEIKGLLGTLVRESPDSRTAETAPDLPAVQQQGDPPPCTDTAAVPKTVVVVYPDGSAVELPADLVLIGPTGLVSLVCPPKDPSEEPT